MSKFKVGDKVLISDGMGRELIALINSIDGDWYLVGCDYMLEHEIKIAPPESKFGWV
ncbi:hypothetical protein [Acinetobacter phage vB_AbM_WUPSU]|nr:hypothetical protein [Acinetobacter phage vB_AbM_WUPSU]